MLPISISKSILTGFGRISSYSTRVTTVNENMKFFWNEFEQEAVYGYPHLDLQEMNGYWERR